MTVLNSPSVYLGNTIIEIHETRRICEIFICTLQPMSSVLKSYVKCWRDGCELSSVMCSRNSSRHCKSTSPFTKMRYVVRQYSWQWWHLQAIKLSDLFLLTSVSSSPALSMTTPLLANEQRKYLFFVWSRNYYISVNLSSSLLRKYSVLPACLWVNSQDASERYRAN